MIVLQKYSTGNFYVEAKRMVYLLLSENELFDVVLEYWDCDSIIFFFFVLEI